MKQHFRTVQDFTEKLGTSGLISAAAGMSKVPSEAVLIGTGVGMMPKVPSDAALLVGTGGGMMPKVASDSTLVGVGRGMMPKVPSDSTLVLNPLPSTELLHGHQQAPAVMGAGSTSSKRRNPLRRTTSMQDMKHGARSSPASAAIPIIRMAPAAVTDDAAHAASSAPHASGNFIALRATDTTPPLRSAGFGAAAATTTGSAGRLLPLSKAAMSSSTSSASDHVNTGPILPVVTALDDDFCMLLWKASF